MTPVLPPRRPLLGVGVAAFTLFMPLESSASAGLSPTHMSSAFFYLR